MYSIKLQLLIDVSKDKVFDKLTSIEGLRQWWTEQTTGSTSINGKIDFRFGDRYHIKMKVMETVLNKIVKWECIHADADWIGTKVTFSLNTENGRTLLRFRHDNWPTHGDFFAHCNLSWAKYLLSLRQLLETGKGQPFQP